ncbi:hypothetical protein QQ045_013899 [Rhodiola kirilowii]
MRFHLKDRELHTMASSTSTQTLFITLLLSLLVFPPNQQTQALTSSSCNWFKGSWVFDPSYDTHYNFKSCPLLDPEFNCQKYNRPDINYLKYRWQPSACILPMYIYLLFFIHICNAKICSPIANIVGGREGGCPIDLAKVRRSIPKICSLSLCNGVVAPGCLVKKFAV